MATRRRSSTSRKTGQASAAKQTSEKPTSRQEFSIDELARAAGTTVRNVRAYQDRGVLPPPERRGRKGIYTNVHLELLKVIGQLLDRGYTLSNIGELLQAVEQGHDLNQLIGLEAAIASPWTGENPKYFTISQLSKLFKVKISLKSLGPLDEAIRLGIIEREGARFRAPSPRLIYVASDLIKLGIPVEDLLEILRMMRGNVQRVADELIKRIVPIYDRYGDDLPPPDEVPELADVIWQLRPLAEAAMNIEAMRALEKATNKFLGDRIAHVLESMQVTKG
ncbi:MAG: MerR family transcriptional regulator [Salinisphaeraceae bacterium]|nr:MerR family transcriptional regulator [Salinisphaeraceae bacterium]